MRIKNVTKNPIHNYERYANKILVTSENTKFKFYLFQECSHGLWFLSHKSQGLRINECLNTYDFDKAYKKGCEKLIQYADTYLSISKDAEDIER